MNSENYFDGSNHSANNTSFQHTIEVMRAASPYLSSEQRPSVDLLVKFGDLMNAFSIIKKGNQTLSAQSSEVKSMDLEGLLGSIRNICFEKERKLIDMLLNFFKAKRMFETFNSLSQLMSPNQDIGNFSNFDINSFATMFQGASSMFGERNEPTSNFHSDEEHMTAQQSSPSPTESPTNSDDFKAMAQDVTSNSDIIFSTDEPFDEDTSSEFSESLYYNSDYNQEHYHSPFDDDNSPNGIPTAQFYSDSANYNNMNHQSTNSFNYQPSSSTNSNTDNSTYTYHTDNTNTNSSYSNNTATNTKTTSTNSTTSNNNSNTNTNSNNNNLEMMVRLIQTMQNGNNSNNMSEVLGNLLTPEQKNTFETISSLMNTM